MSLAKIRSGDLVTVITGKNRGKTGTVETVFTARHRVIVTGVNVVKKHAKASGRYPTGGVISKSLPINTSNVMLLCPNCQKPTRVTRSVDGDNHARVCRRCHQIIQAKSAHE